jgi:hypothetical protein
MLITWQSLTIINPAGRGRFSGRPQLSIRIFGEYVLSTVVGFKEGVGMYD